MKFADQHNKLLTSQVLLTGAMQEFAAGQTELRERMKDLTESQKATDTRLSILVQMMDPFIRERGDK